MQVDKFACVFGFLKIKKSTYLGAGGGKEVGEDAGDRPQPAQAGAEDEVID